MVTKDHELRQFGFALLGLAGVSGWSEFKLKQQSTDPTDPTPIKDLADKTALDFKNGFASRGRGLLPRRAEVKAAEEAVLQAIVAGFPAFERATSIKPGGVSSMENVVSDLDVLLNTLANDKDLDGLFLTDGELKLQKSLLKELDKKPNQVAAGHVDTLSYAEDLIARYSATLRPDEVDKVIKSLEEDELKRYRDEERKIVQSEEYVKHTNEQSLYLPPDAPGFRKVDPRVDQKSIAAKIARGTEAREDEIKGKALRRFAAAHSDSDQLADKVQKLLGPNIKEQLFAGLLVLRDLFALRGVLTGELKVDLQGLARRLGQDSKLVEIIFNASPSVSSGNNLFVGLFANLDTKKLLNIELRGLLGPKPTPDTIVNARISREFLSTLGKLDDLNKPDNLDAFRKYLDVGRITARARQALRPQQP